MKNLLAQTLFISLLLSAAIPSGVQAGLSFNAKKNLVKAWSNSTDFLNWAEKGIVDNKETICKLPIIDVSLWIYKTSLISKMTKEPKKLAKNAWDNKWNYSAYLIAQGLTDIATTDIHEWGHKTVFNYFYPNSAKILGVSERGDGAVLGGGSTAVCIQELDFHKNNNHLKMAAGAAAGPIIGFLASYIPYKLLKYCTGHHTNYSFLPSLEYGFKQYALVQISDLVNIMPSSDGQAIWQHLQHKDKKINAWYHHLLNQITFQVLKCCLQP